MKEQKKEENFYKDHIKKMIEQRKKGSKIKGSSAVLSKRKMNYK